MNQETSSILAVAAALAAVVGVPALDAQTPETAERRLIAFELEDQFDREYRAADFEGRVVIAIVSDRDGSEFSPQWGTALSDALSGEPGFDRLAFVPVAHLTGVPFFIKGMVRSRFPDDPDQWALLDWDGEFDEAYDLVEKSANILVFAADGRLAQHAAGTEVDAAVLDRIVLAVKELMTPGGS